jgi:hypothetical protein
MELVKTMSDFPGFPPDNLKKFFDSWQSNVSHVVVLGSLTAVSAHIWDGFVASILPLVGWCGVLILTANSHRFPGDRKPGHIALLGSAFAMFLAIGMFVAAQSGSGEVREQSRRTQDELEKQQGRLEAVGKENAIREEELRAKLQKSAEELAEVTSTAEILEIFGGFERYARWNLYEDREVPVSLGRCVGPFCPQVKLRGVQNPGPDAFVVFDVLGAGDLSAAIPLRKGCSREVFTMGKRSIVIAVEDDTYAAPVMGLAVKERHPAPRASDPGPAPDWTLGEYVVAHSSQKITCPQQEYRCTVPGSHEIADGIACFRDRRSNVIVLDAVVAGRLGVEAEARSGNITGWLLADIWKLGDEQRVGLYEIDRPGFKFSLFKNQGRIHAGLTTGGSEYALSCPVDQIPLQKALFFAMSWNPRCRVLYLGGLPVASEGECPGG